MTDYNNDNNNEFEDFEEEAPTTPAEEEMSGKPAGSRNFMVAIGVIGGISLLMLIALIVIGLVILPARNKSRLQTAAMINAQNTATSQAATQVMQAQLDLAKTPTVTETPQPSETPVVALATATLEVVATTEATQGIGGPEAAADLNARTQTVAALLTQAAGGNATATPGAGTPTALPTTGFFDEGMGLPMIVGAAFLLIVVIFIARRLRLSPNS